MIEVEKLMRALVEILCIEKLITVKECFEVLDTINPRSYDVHRQTEETLKVLCDVLKRDDIK
jgi:hypothetical protein